METAPSISDAAQAGDKGDGPTREDEVEVQVSGDGTLISASFMVFNSAVGTGILTLPFSFRVAGAGLGAAMLIFFCVLMGIINCILSRCAEESGGANYQGLVKHFLGRRASAFMSAVVAVYCFFACVGGLIIVGDVSHPILIHLNNGGDAWWTSRPLPITVGAFLAFPLMCLRDITALRFSAMLSFAAIMYVVFVVVYLGAQNAKDPETLSDRGTFNMVEWSWQAFLAVPNIFLSFQCQIQVPSIFAELRPEFKSARLMKRVIVASHTVILAFYLAVAFAGYYTFRGITPANVMKAPYGKDNTLMLVARCALSITAVCSVPVNHFPARSAMYQLWSSYRRGPREEVPAEDVDGIQRAESDVLSRSGLDSSSFIVPGQASAIPKSFIQVETGVWFAVMLAMGLTIPNLDVLNNILGCTAGTTVIFFLPALLILRSSRQYAILIIAIGVVAFVISASDFVASTFFTSAA